MTLIKRSKRLRDVKNPRKNIVTTTVTPEVFNAIADYAAKNNISRSRAMFCLLKIGITARGLGVHV